MNRSEFNEQLDIIDSLAKNYRLFATGYDFGEIQSEQAICTVEPFWIPRFEYETERVMVCFANRSFWISYKDLAKDAQSENVGGMITKKFIKMMKPQSKGYVAWQTQSKKIDFLENLE